MPNKIKIAFDIDSTCVDFITPFAERIFHYTQKDISQCTRYNIVDEYSIPEDIMWESAHDVYRNYHDTPIYDGVPELMSMLSEAGQEPIRFVTSRPRKWAHYAYLLVERFCKVPFYICFSRGYSKLDFLGGYSWFADDKRGIARELAAAGINVFLVNQTYNQGCDGGRIFRIGGVGELVKHVKMLVD